MSSTQGKWTRRMGLALLPIGVLGAGLVALRVVLVVTGILPGDPLDLLWIVV